MDRRAFLVTGTAALAACSSPGTTGTAQVPGTSPAGAVPDWEWVRAQFNLVPDHIHMSSFLLSSYPRSVREEIERHRREIDQNPVLALKHGRSEPAGITAAAGGRAPVTERIHQLNTQCKDGLAAMKHIRLHTPRNPRLSSGIICCEVNAMTPDVDAALSAVRSLAHS